jgi:hypothetical protein
MFDTTYVDQLGKTISGEFYFGIMCRETRRRIAISTDTSKGKLRYSQPGETIVSCHHCRETVGSTIVIYSLFSKSAGIDEPDRPAILWPAESAPENRGPPKFRLVTMSGGGLGRLDLQNFAGARDRAPREDCSP